MIVYERTKADFASDFMTGDMDGIIARAMKEKADKKVAPSELTAYKNSIHYMHTVLADGSIPDDARVSIEYHIPQSAKRIDFIISGTDGVNSNVIIVELKQWSEARLTNKDGIVETKFQGRYQPTSHPSYQAWSYAALLQSFNATVEEENIQLVPCAYLHNYGPDAVIQNEHYQYYLDKAPVFLKPDALKLRAFIKQFIKYGDPNNAIARIENGKIRPSKSLIDSIQLMLKGNEEFIMIDEQKVVLEAIMDTALHSNEQHKNVIIVKGGPGTGKSVVAINALIKLNSKGKMAQYVTKTSAPRDVYFSKLKGTKPMAELQNLFVGSGSFMSAPKNAISTLLVDEAHRLTEKTGFLKRGDNQIKEIIDTATCAVFFIDEDQRISIQDYGEISKIEYFAGLAGAAVQQYELASQFRCNGSDGYLAWLDDVLQIRETANREFDEEAFHYTFKVVDDPNTLREMIEEKNQPNNKARLVAGFCWDWKSKKDKSAIDIQVNDFQMQWNFFSYESAWLIDPASVNQVGCIHTSQGLELDYIGVIIGEDLIYRDGSIQVDASKRSKEDMTVRGYKKMMKSDPIKTEKLLSTIIRNTYRTLMSRAMKGCYVYCVDRELGEYFKRRLVK